MLCSEDGCGGAMAALVRVSMDWYELGVTYLLTAFDVCMYLRTVCRHLTDTCSRQYPSSLSANLPSPSPSLCKRQSELLNGTSQYVVVIVIDRCTTGNIMAIAQPTYVHVYVYVGLSLSLEYPVSGSRSTRLDDFGFWPWAGAEIAWR